MSTGRLAAFSYTQSFVFFSLVAFGRSVVQEVSLKYQNSFFFLLYIIGRGEIEPVEGLKIPVLPEISPYCSFLFIFLTGYHKNFFSVSSSH